MLFFGLMDNVRQLVVDANFERIVADLPAPDDLLEGELG